MTIPTAGVFRASKTIPVVLVPLLLGCQATTPTHNFGEITLTPGESLICASDPCTVYFETPAGTGTHNILQNGTILAGVAEGGQRVLLGLYSNESAIFRVEGTDLPPAHLGVIGGP